MIMQFAENDCFAILQYPAVTVTVRTAAEKKVL